MAKLIKTWNLQMNTSTFHFKAYSNIFKYLHLETIKFYKIRFRNIRDLEIQVDMTGEQIKNKLNNKLNLLGLVITKMVKLSNQK